MGRLRIRNPANSSWLDICQSEWNVRNSTNTSWRRLVPAHGIRVRHGTDNYWIPIDCLTEEDCEPDIHGGTPDGAGDNGSGPLIPVGSKPVPADPDQDTGGWTPPGDTDSGGSGGGSGGGSNGGSTIPGEQGGTWTGSPGSEPGDWGNTSPGSDYYYNSDLGSSPEGEGDSSCYQGSIDATDGSYPPGYDLPDSCGPGAGLQTNEIGGLCIYRPGLGLCEEYESGGGSNGGPGGGTLEDALQCGFGTYFRRAGIREQYWHLGYNPGQARIWYKLERGKGSVDVYLKGKRVATTDGQTDGQGFLAFMWGFPYGHDPMNDNIIMIRYRGNPDTVMQISVSCPDEYPDGGAGGYPDGEDGPPGVLTNPAACHGTFEPSHGGGSGVHESHHNFEGVSGPVVLDYQMWNISDKLDVFYEGTRVATTGGYVAGVGQLRWNHVHNQSMSIVVAVTSSSDETSWVYLLTCPGSDGNKANPYDCGPESSTNSKGASVTDTYYDVGTAYGTVKVTYQMQSGADSMDIYQSDNLVATTGGPVSGDGELSFDYSPGADTLLRIRMTGIGKTSWSFQVSCAETVVPCGTAWSGQDERTVTNTISGPSAAFALVEYATVGPAFSVPNGGPNRITVSGANGVIEDTVNKELRWENGGYGGLAVPVTGLSELNVSSPGAVDYWRQTVHCSIVHPNTGVRFSGFNVGLPTAFEYGNPGGLIPGSGAVGISPEPDMLIPGNSAAMGVSMFHTATGKLRFRGQSDDFASVFIMSDNGARQDICTFALAGVTSQNVTIAPGTYFIYVLMENVPDDTPGWVVMDVTETDTGKIVAMTSRDWKMGYFEPNRRYNGNHAVMPEVEALMFDTEAQAQAYMGQNAAPSMQDIFNTWPRTDGPSYYSAPPFAGEAADWTYDSGADRFLMTANTGKPNTILSPDALEYYSFTATLTSAGQDDDGIGIVLAARIVNGVPHLLILARNQGGFTSPASGYGLVYYNGASEQTLIDIGILGDTQGAWSGAVSTVSAERSGDSFTINATKFKGGVFATRTFSLNDNALLAKFKGPASFGFYTYSQAGSTYYDVSMPFAEGRVFAADTNRVWEAQNGAWANKGAAAPFSDYLQWPRVAVNPNNGSRYLVYHNMARKE